MFRRIMTRTFQKHKETLHIIFHISEGILYGISHSGLSGKIYDAIKSLFGEKALHVFTVGYVGLYEEKSGIYIALIFLFILYFFGRSKIETATPEA